MQLGRFGFDCQSGLTEESIDEIGGAGCDGAVVVLTPSGIWPQFRDTACPARAGGCVRHDALLISVVVALQVK